MVEIEEKNQELKQIEISYATEKEKLNQITLQLKEVEEPYRTILTKYYVQGKTLVRVADEMNYNYEYVKRMNGIALNKFDELDK